jgi:hypothetical protein
MKYLSKMLPVVAVLLALGGAIYYVLSEEPKPAAPPSAQAHAAAMHESLVPPSYAKKSS